MKIYAAYIVLDLLVGALIVTIALQATSRYRRHRTREIDVIPPEFEKTDEVSIDPTTGIRMVVWYNKKTGQRLYVPESKHR
ncbi:hypothetical protein [Alicyclobacillus mengziensis]|uniref:Uncharacterized protein n=1 Tax=Alicyclobacillus mengziensis TaxID=2931921 RepID=A0A9X7VYH5_9BACL|nr:hypothetical protein [Alicyclobacillus mengziensis]QSO46827.1 hypothetical protein JZ786_20715 [Alicyclobacillus mengziensis]